ncbi:MAG: enoyl-CoA hydratase/isomerase family protein [Candidatus Eisenbacteria sp.]|nr:enoyl-CoA hydratase/isomerase family protein [Candidatus Eisenbacteria bacterium]
MEYKYLLCEEKGALAVVTVNRPDKLNAINRDMFFELRDMFRDIAANDAVRVVILTGSGQKAFVAGADIAELARLTPTQARDLSRLGQDVMEGIARCPKPVIAAVNGWALGGGLELAMCCHFRIASSTARMGVPEVSLGLIPGYAGTQRLPRLVGLGQAMQMILTGEPVKADEALRIGLVNQIVEPDDLLPTCEKIAGQIASRGPVAVRFAAEAVSRGLDGTLEEGSWLEQTLFGLLWTTEDMKEGCGAFLEKRKPDFHGR